MALAQCAASRPLSWPPRRWTYPPARSAKVALVYRPHPPCRRLVLHRQWHRARSLGDGRGSGAGSGASRPARVAWPLRYEPQPLVRGLDRRLSWCGARREHALADLALADAARARSLHHMCRGARAEESLWGQLSSLHEASAPVPVSHMGAGQPSDSVIALIHSTRSINIRRYVLWLPLSFRPAAGEKTSGKDRDRCARRYHLFRRDHRHSTFPPPRPQPDSAANQRV